MQLRNLLGRAEGWRPREESMLPFQSAGRMPPNSKCGCPAHPVILQHQLDVLKFNSVLTLSTCSRIRSHRLRASGLINLPQQPVELRETHDLLESWVITEAYNSGTSRWERCGGKARPFHTPSRLTTLPMFPRVHRPGSSPQPVLWGCSGGLIT